MQLWVIKEREWINESVYHAQDVAAIRISSDPLWRKEHHPLTMRLVRFLYMTRCPHSLQRMGSLGRISLVAAQSAQMYSITGLRVASPPMGAPPLGAEPAGLAWYDMILPWLQWSLSCAPRCCGEDKSAVNDGQGVVAGKRWWMMRRGAKVEKAPKFSSARPFERLRHVTVPPPLTLPTCSVALAVTLCMGTLLTFDFA